MTPEAFVEHWSSSGGSERGAYAVFLVELCDLLDVEHPQPPKPEETQNRYVIDKVVSIKNGDGTEQNERCGNLPVADTSLVIL